VSLTRAFAKEPIKALMAVARAVKWRSCIDRSSDIGYRSVAAWDSRVGGRVMVDSHSNDEESLRTHVPAKISYVPPALLRYGTLREITLTVGMSGKIDGGKGNDRTH
jgi:hypothetical protein